MPRHPLVALTDVAVRYRNGALGIENVNLTVEPGQLIVVSGDNGAGKTTTLRAISGFLGTEGAKLVAGEVRFAGSPLRNPEPSTTHRMGVVLVPERRKIFRNLTVAENFAVVRCRSSDRTARLEASLELFPDLRNRMTIPAGKLSGGQQQMLAIGRALMSDVRVLMIDEITLGLHADLHEPLYAAVRTIASKERGAIVVDEDLTDAGARFADAHYRIDQGTCAGPDSVLTGERSPR